MQSPAVSNRMPTLKNRFGLKMQPAGINGFRSTQYVCRSRQARQLFAGRAKGFPVAVGGERADPATGAGVRREAVRTAGEVCAAYASGRSAVRIRQSLPGATPGIAAG